MAEAIQRVWLDNIAMARRWLPRLDPVSAHDALKMIAKGYRVPGVIFYCWDQQHERSDTAHISEGSKT